MSQHTPTESQLAVLRQIVEESVGIEMCHVMTRNHTISGEGWLVTRYVRSVPPHIHCTHTPYYLSKSGEWLYGRGRRSGTTKAMLDFQKQCVHKKLKDAEIARTAWLAQIGGAK